tara:strand:- start:982 stop:2679 length:1698 start_codon:yes stop_codon:yes gene_type:complete
MISKRIQLLKKKFSKHNIDGYIVPKNDEFFSEYATQDRLKNISNFTGSAGLAIITKRKNLLFVDGRYTIQAHEQSGKQFKIIKIHKFLPYKIIKNITLGFDPSLFTYKQLSIYFKKSIKLKPINNNLIDEIYKSRNVKNKPFYSLNDKIIGESTKSKINKITSVLKKNKSDYIFISAPENVAWTLNIRGHDNPNSPVPNSRLIIGRNKKVYLIAEKKKVSKIIINGKIRKKNVIDPKKFSNLICSLKGNKFIIDSISCSVLNENIIKSKFQIINRNDPCYNLKSIKNSNEINLMEKAHIEDGVALTKFIYWMKNKKKINLSEIDAQNKLEKFRKMNNNYLFPSFNTIAGTGSNGAIVHYRATKKSNKVIKRKDIFLCDSGGQYNYGTTDVTRTLCFGNQPILIRNIFTKVLKGHIAVFNTNLSKFDVGEKIDIRARKFLKQDGLDYAHGTGHGVGFFLNVHEGPQAISKFNKVKLKEGMIISNEPGFYKKNHFGIRIENLIYVKKFKKKLVFKNLTLAPIDKELINYNLLNKDEKNYLFNYHLEVYSKLSKYLDYKEKKWLISLL